MQTSALSLCVSLVGMTTLESPSHTVRADLGASALSHGPRPAADGLSICAGFHGR